MTTSFLAADIEAEEGREPEAYPDPLSPLGRAAARARLALRDYRRVPGWMSLDAHPWTIGVGCTGPGVGQGVRWSDAQINQVRDQRIAAIEAKLDANISWWRRLSDPRQDVLVQMGFQMGVAGELAFHNTLADVEAGRYSAAADGMLASVWDRQTPARVGRLAAQMKTGVRSR